MSFVHASAQWGAHGQLGGVYSVALHSRYVSHKRNSSV